MRGRTEPRLWTPPLVDLSKRENSYGYDVIDFAEAIGIVLDAWQKWLLIHIGELLPDGRPRFRLVLIIVARQNGKTVLCRVLTLYWMFVEMVPFIVGVSASRDTAVESWNEVVSMAEGIPLLAEELAAKHTITQNGKEAFFNVCGSRYRPFAKNSRAGRGFTVNRLIMDELLEQKTWDVYNAAYKAMSAVKNGQCIAITNQGYLDSLVLNKLRASALKYIDTDIGDPRLGLFEWSAKEGSDPTDLVALSYANPNLTDDPNAPEHHVFIDNIIGEAIRAKEEGGQELSDFRRENMCIPVGMDDPAIDMDAWRDCGTDSPIDLALHRDKLALSFDVSMDATHATLVAAATIDGVTHIEVLKKWTGRSCTADLRAELPGLVDQYKPRKVVWFPKGPAASVAAALAERKGTNRWPPRRVELEELKEGVVPSVCMGLGEQVLSGEIQHTKDPMLTEHVHQTTQQSRGDVWVFDRRESGGPIDGTYAAAGAVQAARTLPKRTPLVAL